MWRGLPWARTEPRLPGPLHVCMAPWARAPVASGLVTLAARYRRSPEGRFESGLVLPDGRDAGVPWRGVLPPWLDAAACELRRNRVPWSRCTLFPVDVMTEPVAASAAPPERLKPRKPKTPVLVPLSIPAASRPPIAPGPACRAPVAPPASDPTSRVAPRPDPTVPPTAPVV